MQKLAFEFNLSENAVLRACGFSIAQPMAFAGHPSIGTAYVMAHAGLAIGDHLRLEVPADIVAVEFERDAKGRGEAQF
jgi:trans-2,3-dihydro-3-hydroxyanthranilate isomerase